MAALTGLGVGVSVRDTTGSSPASSLFFAAAGPPSGCPPHARASSSPGRVRSIRGSSRVTNRIGRNGSGSAGFVLFSRKSGHRRCKLVMNSESSRPIKAQAAGSDESQQGTETAKTIAPAPDNSPEKAPGAATGAAPDAAAGTASRRAPRLQADSTDWIASAVTRRFGIGAGLAWVGFLSFGVISEQIKTRTEVFLEESQTRDIDDLERQTVTLDSGVVYEDLRIGGGATPQRGDLVLVGLVGRVLASAQREEDDRERRPGPFVDTAAPGRKDLVFSFGLRPLAGGVTPGLVEALSTMRAGGRRRVIVPANAGFGDDGAVFGDVVVPGGAALEYIIELKRVSIPPS